jgi:hypothetical protein
MVSIESFQMDTFITGHLAKLPNLNLFSLLESRILEGLGNFLHRQ